MEVVNTSNNVRNIKACEIEVGTVFTGIIKNNGGLRVLLRTYNQVVDLEDPEHTWSCEKREYAPDIYQYHPVRAKLKICELA